MNRDAAIQDLETALLERARSLAEEALARGRQSRDRIIQEENERLRLREERETLAAKVMAERVYQRRVQAAELELQEELDQLRWELMQEVMSGLRARLERFAADDKVYLPVLQKLLRAAVSTLETGELTAELNARDHERLKGRWKAFTEQTCPGREVRLHPQPYSCLGGVRVTAADGRVRVDNTFEGRLERFNDELLQVVAERLFARAVGVGGRVHG